MSAVHAHAPQDDPDAEASTAVGDLSALAWVHDELRKGVETAQKSLRRALRDRQQRLAADPGAEVPPPPALNQARSQLHQAAGALSLVGLPAPARCLEAAERAVLALSRQPQRLDEAALSMLERAGFAVMDDLRRRLAGQPLSPLALFPTYRQLRELAGEERAHPADLCPLPVRQDAPTEPWQASAAARPVDAQSRSEMERGLLQLLRHPGDTAPLRGLSDLCAGLGAGSEGALSELWHLASAFFEVQAAGRLQADDYIRRMPSRLLAQMRSQERGHTAAPDGLNQDLRFFCARAEAAQASDCPRWQQVKRQLGLPALAGVDYEHSPLGRIDPAWLPLARRRAAAFRETWTAVAAGDLALLGQVDEQVQLVAESVRQLYPQGEPLASALTRAALGPVEQQQPPTPGVAMEVATALLCIDASLDEMDLDHPALAQRVQRLAGRLADTAAGAPAAPIEPWMEALYREVSDRQTMGSVVQELRASLAEVEQQLDRFHRHPDERELLIPVPGQLAAMRGVLSVLGLDQASQAVLRMREDVEHLLSGEASGRALDAAARLAENLGGLSFLIDMLGAQPALAKALFRFDPDSGRFSAVMGRAPWVAPSAQAGAQTRLQAQMAQIAQQAQQAQQAHVDGDQGVEPSTDGSPARDAWVQQLDGLAAEALANDAPDVAEAAARARRALQDSPADAPLPASALLEALTPEAAPEPPSAAEAAPMQAGAGSDDLDDDLREVFLDEAAEVLAEARHAREALDERPRDLAAFTALRRGFHTLKGSARMVGLQAVGEAAWAAEQVFNARLAEAVVHADASLLRFTDLALADLGEAVHQLTLDARADWDPQPVIAAAERQRLAPVPAAPPLDRLPEPPTLHAELAVPEAAPLLPPDQVPDPQLEPVFDAVALGEPALDLEPAQDLEPDTESPLPVEASPRGIDLPADLLDLDLDLDLDLEAGPAPAPEDTVLADDDTLLLPEDPLPVQVWEATAPLVDPIPAGEALDLPAEPGLDFELDLGPAAEPLLDLSGPVTEPEPAPALQDLPDTPADDWVVDDVARAEAVLAELDTPAPDAPALDTLAPSEPEPTADASAPPPPLLASAKVLPLDREQYKQVGPLQVPIGLFNIFLNEADEQSRRLATELAEWQLVPEATPSPDCTVWAHSLAGNAATVGYTGLSQLARWLEQALERVRARHQRLPGEADLLAEVAEEIRRLLHQFAAGFLRPVPDELRQRLSAHELAEAGLAPTSAPAQPVPEESDTADLALGQSALSPPAHAPAVAAPSPRAAQSLGSSALGALAEPLDAEDAPDPGLWPIFIEEAAELLPEIGQQLRQWGPPPATQAPAEAAMRGLHTFKGGARLAGAMGLGELAHRLESALELALAQSADPALASAAQSALLSGVDRLSEHFDLLCEAERRASAVEPAPADDAFPHAFPNPFPEAFPEAFPDQVDAAGADLDEARLDLGEGPEPAERPAAAPAPTWVDNGPQVAWARFVDPGAGAGIVPVRPDASNALSGSVRVPVPRLDRLVSQAGELGAARARLDSELGQMRSGMKDLTENLERLRRQLRDLELQAETQMSTRLEAARAAHQAFDPLEMDRFTRVQELTRMLAESVNDVGTVQRGLQQAIQVSEDQLAAQARLARDLQDELLRARMVEFDTLSERLYRVVRQAAKETGKQVRLNLEGGALEVDRSVLDRMAPAFEHLLRNAVVHGIEAPGLREPLGKDLVGQIDLRVRQAGNEVEIEVRDDGAGLDLARIAERARAAGLLGADARPTESELAGLIFQPGFSTADAVTELAGRGIGMDVVRSEVAALGGRIDTTTRSGQGTAFHLLLPLTTAVTQVLLVQADTRRVAFPATLVERVVRVPLDELLAARHRGELQVDQVALPFYWLGGLLGQSAQAEPSAKAVPVVLARGAAQRVAIQVSQVMGQQDVVVKKLGPQLSRLPALSGLSVLPDGAPVLIYNPVALASVHGAQALRRAAALDGTEGPAGPAVAAVVEAAPAPLVLVVDDSLTVRRVTQRLLLREGYRVELAKDGLDAVDALARERPAIVLCDIEMPRMDGFDLLRHVRAEPALAGLPVVMITSRIAERHRDLALSLGATDYLGKPYDEQALLALLRVHTAG